VWLPTHVLQVHARWLDFTGCFEPCKLSFGSAPRVLGIMGVKQPPVYQSSAVLPACVVYCLPSCQGLSLWQNVRVVLILWLGPPGDRIAHIMLYTAIWPDTRAPVLCRYSARPT
jgi:hypothetical protein